MTAHQMTMTDQGDGSYKCACPECGRVMILYQDGEKLYDVLIPGDQEVFHIASTGGITVTRLEFYDPYLAPFEAWDKEHP